MRAFSNARENTDIGVSREGPMLGVTGSDDSGGTMNAPAYNSVAWFQVGTTDAEGAKRFYADLFDWRYTLDPNSEGKYNLVSYPGADTPSGGIVDTGGEFPNHAIFMVVVQDVAALCAQVERLGGKVLVPPDTTKDGLVFADLHDPAGNHFGVFTPPPV
jgi:predicted enzyme related to lactoylglutathione lyase